MTTSYDCTAAGQRAAGLEHAQRAIRDLLQLDDKALKPALVGAGPEADAAASRLRGAVLMSLGRESQAEPELKRALEAAPQDLSVIRAQ